MFKWLTLLRWLGPWCNQARAPQMASHDSMVELNDRTYRFRVYRPDGFTGAVMVLPGLHPDGIDDPRLDRFCKVLAAAGILVGLPELPTMQASVMNVSVIPETHAALAHFQARLKRDNIDKLGVFCISASSIAGLTVATDTRWRGFIHRLHLFGGFAAWPEALRFSMTGEILHDDGRKEQVPIDPLGLPVVYMNLVETFSEFLPYPLSVQQRLSTLWSRFVATTWEKPNVHHPEDTLRIANELVTELSEYDVAVQTLFLQGCSVQDGGHQRVHDFLDALSPSQHSSSLGWLDPEPLLRILEIPIDISHGTADFVVPYPQALQLMKWSDCKRGRVFITGFYHHTGVVNLQQIIRLALQIPKEIWTSMMLVRAIAELCDSSK